jgi:DNA-binding FadR family transcriptional regulator
MNDHARADSHAELRHPKLNDDAFDSTCVETVRGRHEAIYDAIATSDAEEAAERMESHLLESARELGVKASAPTAWEKAR